jgi:iron complex transport system substrate-binding protein
MSRSRASPWLLLTLSLYCAVAASAAPATFPLTVTDDGGASVTIAAKPQRIVSLTLFTDEILLDLVEPGRLAGITTFAADPDISNVAARGAGIGSRLTLSVEPVLALRPDLVFVSNWSEADKVAQLRGAGVPVYTMASGLTVAEIQGKIRTVARLAGEPAKGEAMIGAMSARLAEVKRRVAKIAESAKLSIVDYAVWGSAQGAGSSWDEMLKLAGLVNAVRGLPADGYGQVPLSKEKLLELDPDILILPGWVYGDPKGADAFYAQMLNDPALKTMKAVKKARAYKMPERLKSTVSQYLADAVEYLAKTAYPELFRQPGG